MDSQSGGGYTHDLVHEDQRPCEGKRGIMTPYRIAFGVCFHRVKKTHWPREGIKLEREGPSREVSNGKQVLLRHGARQNGKLSLGSWDQFIKELISFDRSARQKGNIVPQFAFESLRAKSCTQVRGGGGHGEEAREWPSVARPSRKRTSSSTASQPGRSPRHSPGPGSGDESQRMPRCGKPFTMTVPGRRTHDNPEIRRH